MINTLSYGSESVHFFLSFVHACNAAGVPVIKSEDRGLIYRFNSATFLCLSQTMVWIFKVLCRWFFCVCSMGYGDRWLVFVVVDIGGIDEHHCFHNCSSYILKWGFVLAVIQTYFFPYMQKKIPWYPLYYYFMLTTFKIIIHIIYVPQGPSWSWS